MKVYAKYKSNAKSILEYEIIEDDIRSLRDYVILDLTFNGVTPEEFVFSFDKNGEFLNFNQTFS